MPWWGWTIVLLAALYPLHRLFLWMESKDWVYYRSKPKSGAGSAILGVLASVDQGARYVEEARHAIVAEDEGDDDGDRPLEDQISALRRE